MSNRSSNGSGEGLSFETLLIAAIASAVAAVVVSRFWQGGTPIAAAITPIVVSLVSERLPAHYGIDPLRDLQVFSPV